MRGGKLKLQLGRSAFVPGRGSSEHFSSITCVIVLYTIL